MRRLLLACGLAATPDLARAGSFGPPPVAPTAVSVGAVPRWVPVCGRGRPIGSGAWDATDTYVLDVTACTVPSGLGVKALRLSYMGSDMSNVGEIDRMASFTGDAAVALSSTQFSAVVQAPVASGATSIPLQVSMGSPGNGISIGMSVAGTNIASGSWITSVTPTMVGSNVTALSFGFINAAGTTATTGALTAGQVLTITGRNHVATWGGARSTTIFPARRFFDSDPIGIDLAPGAGFTVRGSWTASAPGFYVGDYPAPASGSTRLAGEGSQRSTASLGDHVMDQFVPSNSGGGYLSPWTVLGQVTAPTASVLIVGDSIAAGSGDAADGFGHMGYIQRSLGQAVPWASIARGSTTAQQMSVNLQLVEQAAAEIGATDVLLEYDRNDINAPSNPQPAVAVEGYLRTIAAPLLAAGYRVWVFTCVPTTDSTDGWTTAAGQFFQQQATAATAATAAGAGGAAVTVAVASSSGIQAGELAGTQNTASLVIPTGTAVTSVPDATHVVLTPPAGAAIGAIASGTVLGFGTKSVTATGTPIEAQREALNAYLRANWQAQGYAGLIDVAGAVEDAANPGQWRVDQGAASVEGIHPSAALHALVASLGLITPSMFQAR